MNREDGRGNGAPPVLLSSRLFSGGTMNAPRRDPIRIQVAALGEFIKSQRTLANLSLRELAARTEISNPYLSQIERGLHEPSVRVLKSIAKALNVSAETLLA